MPELPEITCRAREMNAELVGRTIESIEVLQAKCLNVSVDEFKEGLVGAEIKGVTNRGKWLFVETTNGHLLLNLGMGGEILLVASDKMPGKWRIRFDFGNGETIAVNFWWFRYAHYVAPGKRSEHKLTSVLGSNALDVSLDGFRALLSGRRGRIKAFLLDQSRIAGIGNAYIHDILFRAKLHPLRLIPTLSDEDIERLHAAMHTELQRSIDVRGAYYEVDLHDQPGGFTGEDLLIGYREGKPCPECGTTIEKIKTGSTSSFICPKCQPLEG